MKKIRRCQLKNCEEVTQFYFFFSLSATCILSNQTNIFEEGKIKGPRNIENEEMKRRKSDRKKKSKDKTKPFMKPNGVPMAAAVLNCQCSSKCINHCLPS